MLQVCFDCYGSYTTDSVYQWDLNRRLAIRGLDYDSAPAIHFSNKKSNQALVVQSTIEDGVIYCDVPNILLQEPYDIVGYVCECLDQELTTYETIRIPVKPRVKPADYAYENNVEILTYYALMSEITSVKASTEKDIKSMDASKASKTELNTVKTELETSHDTDINKVENEIATERARIDQLVASPEIGEGDLEKEVGDLRVDVKGTTHDSAGTAVREQILELNSKIDANVSTLSGDIIGLRNHSGYVNTFYQNKTSDHDCIIPSGKYRVSITSQSSVSVGVTVVLCKEKPYVSGNQSNLIAVDNQNAQWNPTVEIVIADQYNYVHIWQSDSNVEVNITLEQLCDTTEILESLDNNYGKRIFSFLANGTKPIANDISVLEKGKNVVFVFEYPAQDFVIRLDTNSTYDANSENRLTIVEGYTGNYFISDIIHLDKDYKSLIAYNKPADKHNVIVYEVNTLVSEISSEIKSKQEQSVDQIIELKPTWSQYWFDGSGGTGTILHTDGVATDKMTANGLYLITFPDELTATYNVMKYEDGITRRNIESFHPFSILINAGDFLRVCIKRKDGGELLPSDEILNEVKIHVVNGLTPDCDVSVAPFDATMNKKEKASITLDGVNDTKILASLFGCYNSINVLLYNGTYNINELWTHSETSKIALSFNDYNFDGGLGYRRYISVCGEMPSTPQTLDSVRFCVSKDLHESLLNSGINYFVIGTPYPISDNEIQRMATTCNLKNFNIIGYKYDKPITYIDTTRCLSTMIECVNVRSWAENIAGYNPFNETPNAECCGIRVGRGSNYGIHNYVKHLNVWYCGKGVACNGEHFVFEDVKTHHDYIGFVFGDRKTVGHQEHPNIMIGCSIEGCYRLMILSKSGVTIEQDYESTYSKSTLVMIGTSTENKWRIPVNEVVGDTDWQKTLPIKEIVKSAWRGRIEIDWLGELFEEESGKGFTVNKY